MLGKGWVVPGVVLILIFGGLAIFFRAYFSSGLQTEGPVETSTQKTLGESKTIVLASPQVKVSPKIMIASKSAAVVPSPAFTPVPKPSLSPQPSPGKSVYTIAAFGDSMVDTMGENLDYLQKNLKTKYPNTEFKLYNYGIGSQNVIDAEKRFSDAFSYQTRKYPPIDQINADVIIISSFAYNPLYPYDKNAYLTALKQVLAKAKNTGARVYLLAEIAPLKEGFGKGAGGVNWDEQKTNEHVGYILENLDAAVTLASETKTPLINAYKKSQVDGKYGNKIYVGNHDGIHPSIEGEVFMADLIAQTLKLP